MIEGLWFRVGLNERFEADGLAQDQENVGFLCFCCRIKTIRS